MELGQIEEDEVIDDRDRVKKQKFAGSKIQVNQKRQAARHDQSAAASSMNDPNGPEPVVKEYFFNERVSYEPQGVDARND